MKPEPLRIALVLYLAAAACGPTSNTDTGQASSSTAVVSAGTTSSTSGTTGVVDPSTTSTTTSTSDTGAPTSSGGNTFIVTPDGGGTSDYTCDVFKQDCKRGQKCTAWAEDGGGAWNATRCVEVTGSKVPGDVCMT